MTTTIGQLIGFRRELFFEGAVQLGWLDKAPERSEAAARSYVFHGPELHAVGRGDHDGELRRAALQDTATFFRDVIAESTTPQPAGSNPFRLAIAGYGTGKSHLGVTLAQVLGGYPSATAQEILDHLEAAAPGLGAASRADLEAAGAPVLVVALDGMGDFNLGSELYRKIAGQLRARNLDLGPLDELSPRFDRARQFVRLNFDLRKVAFEESFGVGAAAAAIMDRLADRDEACFLAVDGLYRDAVGAAIPAEGTESPEELILTVCDQYCGRGKPFASLLILFDEFGRYLEFAADKPHVAGDSALQQMYQGVQTAGTTGRCHFLGLIQFDLKTYMALLEKRDARALMRFVPRFETAGKALLSSNMETLFANLIERRRPAEVQALLATAKAEAAWKSTHQAMAQALRGMARWAVWADRDAFRRVIVGGCWPLHPTTAWFLARLDNVIQSRSALTFVESALARIADDPIEADGLPRCIYPADMILGDMFNDILDAERRTHGAIAGEFAAIRERYAGKWTADQERALAAIVAAQKMRVQAATQDEADAVLALLAGMAPAAYTRVLREVSEVYGVAEWNADHKQYDLVIDAVSRSQFSLFLRRKAGELTAAAVQEHFRLYGIQACGLEEPESSFAAKRRINTSDWRYAVSCTASPTLDADVDRAVTAWRAAQAPQDAKGQLLYHLVLEGEDEDKALAAFEHALEKALKSRGGQLAPVFGLQLVDGDGEMARELARLHVLERKLTAADKDNYQRFLEAEAEAIRHRLRENVEAAMRRQRFIFPKGTEITAARLDMVATQLFEAIYPAALPFVFDGFGTKTITGTKDCAVITKAAAARAINQNWSSSLPIDTGNRARTLLVAVWKTHTSEFRALREVGCEPLARLLDELGSRLVAKKTLDLHALFLELLAPPYGFNTASAGLVVGLFIGGNQPLKGLADAQGPLAVDDWLKLAYQGKNQIAVDRLKGTRVVHVEASVAEAWQLLFDKWVVEQGHRELVRFRDRVLDLSKKVPMPAEHQDQAALVHERAASAEQEIREFEKRLDKWHDTLQRFRKGDLAPILDRANEAFFAKRDMEKDRRWAAEDLAMVEDYLEAARGAIRAGFPEWLADQRPSSIEGLGDFQKVISKHVVTLEKLRMDEAGALKERGRSAANRLELELHNTAALDAAHRFLDAVRVNPATPLVLLGQWLVDLRQQRDALDLVQRLNPAAAGPLVAELAARETAIEAQIATQKARLQGLAERSLDSFDALRDALEEADQAFAATEGTPERDFVQELRRQLKASREDWSSLQQFDGLPTELDALVAARIAARESEFETMGAEPYWDFAEVYQALAAERHLALSEQARRWFEGIVPDVGAIDKWTLERCVKARTALGDRPTSVAGELSGHVDQCIEDLGARIAELEEARRQQQADAWIEANVPQSTEDDLPFDVCRVALERLEQQLPTFLTPADAARVGAARDRLAQRLDDLDISKLIERARRLPSARLRELIARLQDEFVAKK